MNPKDTVHGKVAFDFATALISGSYVMAHEFIASSVRAQWPPSVLQDRYESMISYGEGPAHDVKVIEALLDWPDKKPDDLGWAYAAIEGNGYSEAVSVIVCNENGKPVIRAIEWGRP